MLNVVLSYYYLLENLQFVVCLLISCLEIRLKSAAAPSELLVQHWWHAGGVSLVVLDLLCFRCVFSAKIAITNIWREKSFSISIQTVVQASCFFPR